LADREHFFVLVEGMRKYLSGLFTDYLGSRKYDCEETESIVSPDTRQVRFYDIITYESCASQLLHDLSPYNVYKEGGYLDKWVKRVRALFGLQNPSFSEFQTLSNDWRKDMDVVVIGRFDDKWKNGREFILKREDGG
jgi:hypothetical protein